MNKIVVDKECGCFKKSAYENNVSFESKDDALLQAGIMVKHMNTKFCAKHNFVLSEKGDDFLIHVSPAKKAESSGCCGGGCSSH